VRHGHVEVNAERVDVPSFRVVPGVEVRVAAASREMVPVKAAQEQATRGAPLSWIQVDQEKATGRVLERPTREAIPINAQEQLIVELYSK
jgi:small subunit ribosomal protein S4